MASDPEPAPEAGGRQVFGAVAKADTDSKMLIRRSLDAAGRTEDTALTAFADGCPGPRRILADAGVIGPPILDWFHIAKRLPHLKQIAMRLQHLEQIAGDLSPDDPDRVIPSALEIDPRHQYVSNFAGWYDE
ncbi:MAG TPA: hypothetical protein VK741_19300 [Acetobacteraceae bacterium]|nr:hypothetical protein [Acetobacteraceae bacterium]